LATAFLTEQLPQVLALSTSVTVLSSSAGGELVVSLRLLLLDPVFPIAVASFVSSEPPACCALLPVVALLLLLLLLSASAAAGVVTTMVCLSSTDPVIGSDVVRVTSS
jgi:hypothetical protein